MSTAKFRKKKKNIFIIKHVEQWAHDAKVNEKSWHNFYTFLCISHDQYALISNYSIFPIQCKNVDRVLI